MPAIRDLLGEVLVTCMAERAEPLVTQKVRKPDDRVERCFKFMPDAT